MPCFYCGKRVSLVRQLTDADFCSEDHRKKYHELTRMALNRLVESHEQMVATPVSHKGRGATAVEEPPAAIRPTPEPVPEQRVIPAPEKRPTPPPKRAPQVVIAPPPPPPPPPMRIPSEPGFVLSAMPAYSMEDRPWFAPEIELRTVVCELGRQYAPTVPAPSPRMGGPVWPRLDPDTLRRAGRARPAAGFFHCGFGVPPLQCAYSRRVLPCSGLAQPGNGTFFPVPALLGLKGSLSLRTPITASIDSKMGVLLAQLPHLVVPAVFPSGGLSTRYARPGFRTLRSAIYAEPAPEFSVGFFLPELAPEAAPSCAIPSGVLIATAMPASVNTHSVAQRVTKAAGFARPGVWLPELKLRPIYTDPTAAVETVVPGWILAVPRPLGLPRILLVEPTPTRAPRPVIPVSGAWSGASHMPAAALIPAIPVRPAGTGRILAAMTRPVPPATFALRLILPAAQVKAVSDLAAFETPPEAAHIPLARPAAVRALEHTQRRIERIAPAVPAVSMPLAALAGPSGLGSMPGAALTSLAHPPAFARTREATAVWPRSAPLFAAATPVLPQLPAHAEALGTVPGSAACMELALPAPIRGRRPGPTGVGQLSLRSPARPLLEASVSGLFSVLAPKAFGSQPGAGKSVPARAGAGGAAKAGASHQFAIDPCGFSLSTPGPIRRPFAPAVAGCGIASALSEPVHVPQFAAPELQRGLAAPGPIAGVAVPRPTVGRRERAAGQGLDFAPRPRTVDSPCGSKARVPAAEYAASPSPRPASVRPMAHTAGPEFRDCAVSLPFDGQLASTALLASVEGFVRQPKPIAGILPRALADLTPCVPPLGGPQIAAVGLALLQRTWTSVSGLQSVAMPRVRTRPAVPRSLPRIEMPAAAMSMLELAASCPLHALPHPERFPMAVAPTARERRPAATLRQDLQVAEPRLPELGAFDRVHVLGSALPFPPAILAVSRKPRPSLPAGAITGALPVALPARMRISTAAYLGTGEAATLPSRPAAWTLTSHSMGWAAFPPDETCMPGPRLASLGAIVLPAGGLETMERPKPKLPQPASPQSSVMAFPLAEPSRPQTEVAGESRELPAMAPTVVPPVALRGTPQAPWKTTAAIPVRSARLPSFIIEPPAPLGLGGQDLQPPVPSRACDAAALRKARRVAVPIRLSDDIHAPEAGLRPPRYLAVGSAGIVREAKFPNPRKVASHAQPVTAAEFSLAAPAHAQSQMTAACYTLEKGAPWTVASRTQAGAFKISSAEQIGLQPRSAALPSPRTASRAVLLTVAGWERVPPRNRAGAFNREQVGWQALDRDCTTTNFRSIESRVTALEWPTRSSGDFLNGPKPAAKRAGFRIAPFSGTDFPCPAALWPESAGFTQALRSAPLAGVSAPGFRQALETTRKIVRLEPVFRVIRRPGRLPVFRAPYRKASMPSGYFAYFEAHEDFDDYGTMGIAPVCEASPLEAVIPATRHATSLSGDLEHSYWAPQLNLAHDRSPRPIGAFEFQVSLSEPQLPGQIDAIPEDFEASMAAVPKGPGIVGALKNASRFFKFMTLGVPGLLIFSMALWSALGDSTLQTLQARAAVQFEQDFRSEMNAWFGGPDWGKNWSHDSGGFVRVGQLALYRPSMMMDDYRMDFLGQVDRRSMGWVFRAADLRNYYAMRIVIVKRGPLPSAVLERYAVIDGRETQRVRIPIRVVLHNGRPYRVQVNVVGNGFTTLIEGKIVDFWSDDRFPEGGVGFFSDSKEDRAHLYWMRVAHQDDFLGRVCATIAPG